MYRVMVYDSLGTCHCEYETSKESKAEEYAYQNVMKREGVNRFYIDKVYPASDKRSRFIEDEDY